MKLSKMTLSISYSQKENKRIANESVKHFSLKVSLFL